MSWPVFLFGLVCACVLWFAGAIFGVNGDQWNWWRAVSWIAAAVAIVAAIWAARRHGLSSTGVKAPLRRWLLAAATVGLLAVVASVVVMAHSYSDPYAGSRVWPDVLASVALLGFVVAAGSVASLVKGRRRAPQQMQAADR